MKAGQTHWPGWLRTEYFLEAAGLGLFLLSACSFAVVLEHPDGPGRHALADPGLRRLLMGLAMGLTAVTIIYSPWGRRSGAHLNPAVTLTFFRLGRVAPRDVGGYLAGQFVGGAGGVGLAALVYGPALADPAVHYVVTTPGPAGAGVAFLVETIMAATLMFLVLTFAGSQRLSRYTGIMAGICVATFIFLAAPISGMSLNPARSLASALAAGDFRGIWVYFSAPLLGMLTAASLYPRAHSRVYQGCAKMCHDDRHRCVFCEYMESASRPASPGGGEVAADPT